MGDKENIEEEIIEKGAEADYESTARSLTTVMTKNQSTNINCEQDNESEASTSEAVFDKNEQSSSNNGYQGNDEVPRKRGRPRRNGFS